MNFFNDINAAKVVAVLVFAPTAMVSIILTVILLPFVMLVMGEKPQR